MGSKDPEYRTPPKGLYRIIEIDRSKQGWFGGRIPDENQFTTIVGDFSDWDEAFDALTSLTHKDCRRQMWCERGITGENNQGKLFTVSMFR